MHTIPVLLESIISNMHHALIIDTLACQRQACYQLVIITGFSQAYDRLIISLW